MDPNACLAMMQRKIRWGQWGDVVDKDLDSTIREDVAELCEALLEWLERGGFDPEWNRYPTARDYFLKWRDGRLA